MSGVEDQIMRLLKTKVYGKPKGVKAVYRGGKKQSEENIIKCIRKLFKLKKKMQQLKVK